MFVTKLLLSFIIVCRRFEVQIEIYLPSEQGRLEILRIHTKEMSEHGLLDADVDLEKIAQMTPLHSGAELAGAVRFVAMRIIYIKLSAYA